MPNSAQNKWDTLFLSYANEMEYCEIQAGSSFSLWPSMYEPFGGVSEFLMQRTPVIARSTGGLRQQIVDFDETANTGNGILFETMQPGDQHEWRRIQLKRYPQDRLWACQEL